jgi:hypothetical protein
VLRCFSEAVMSLQEWYLSRVVRCLLSFPSCPLSPSSSFPPCISSWSISQSPYSECVCEMTQPRSLTDFSNLPILWTPFSPRFLNVSLATSKLLNFLVLHPYATPTRAILQNQPHLRRLRQRDNNPIRIRLCPSFRLRITSTRGSLPPLFLPSQHNSNLQRLHSNRALTH